MPNRVMKSNEKIIIAFIKDYFSRFRFYGNGNLHGVFVSSQLD